MCTQSRHSSVGIATRYGLDGPGIEFPRSQWPSGLRRGSAAYHLLELRVQIPPGAWMFYSKDKRQSQKNKENEVQTKYREQKRNRSGSEIFRTRPDRPCDIPRLLCNGYRISFPGVKRPRHGVNHPSTTSATVKERVEIYLYSPSAPS